MMDLIKDVPEGTTEQLTSHLHTLREKNRVGNVSLDEEFGIELDAVTVTGARNTLFVNFCIQMGILTSEQALQFEILHERNIQEAQKGAREAGAKMRAEGERRQREAAILGGVRGSQGKSLLGPNGVPVRRRPA